MADVFGSKRPRQDNGKEKAVEPSKKKKPAFVLVKPVNLTIHDPSDTPSSQAKSSGRGKQTAAPSSKGGKTSSRKRARPASEIPLIPSAPEVGKFDALAVLANCLSEAAAVKRDELAKAST